MGAVLYFMLEGLMEITFPNHTATFLVTKHSLSDV